MKRLSFVALVAAIALATPLEAQKRGDRNLITKAEIEEASGSINHALDAVQRLRPVWLKPSMGRMTTSNMSGELGAQGSTEPIAYIDEKRQPNVDVLRTVAARELKEIKYLDQNRAVQMLGPGHEAGAIMVYTEKR